MALLLLKGSKHHYILHMQNQALITLVIFEINFLSKSGYIGKQITWLATFSAMGKFSGLDENNSR
jgi:hypothetical protein